MFFEDHVSAQVSALSNGSQPGGLFSPFFFPMDTGKKKPVKDTVNTIKREPVKTDVIADTSRKTKTVKDTLTKKTVVAEKDTAKLDRFVIGGAVVNTVGFLSTPLPFLVGGITWVIPAGLLIIGTLLTVIGLKQIKKDRKKWKGEKLANYALILLTIVGVALILYPVFWLVM